MRTGPAFLVILSAVAFAGLANAQGQPEGGMGGMGTTGTGVPAGTEPAGGMTGGGVEGGGAVTTTTTTSQPVAAGAVTVGSEVLISASGAGPGATGGNAQGTGPGSAIATTEATRPDHEIVTQRVGFHYFGSPTVPALTGGGMAMPGAFPVHTLGVRYWLNPRLGVEAGLGLNYAGGSQSQSSGGTTTSSGQPSEFAFGLHLGLPIGLGWFRHVNFAFVPFISLYQGFGSHTINPANPTSFSLSSTTFTLGGQAMVELSLGMIGLPQVSIEGRFGLQLQVRSDTLETAMAGIPSSANETNVSFGTTIGNWSFTDVLSSSVAVTYYF